MITAIVTSDNHLGVYYARLRPDRLEERRRSLQKAFERVVDAALERRADLFLHAGDLFDRPDPRNAERLFVARQMRRLGEAHIPIFAITGNHDSPRSYGYDGGIAPQEELAALDAIHLFRNSHHVQSKTVKIQGQRVCIWGMSSDFNRPLDVCPLEDIVKEHQREGDINIGLLHYGVEGWARADVQEPTLSLENLDKLQADALCIGHLHDRQQKRLPGGAVLLNPGGTEHIHFGEEKLECGFWILKMEPGHVEAEYVPLPSQPMRTLKIDLTDWPSPPGPLSPAWGEGEREESEMGLVEGVAEDTQPESTTSPIADSDAPLSPSWGEGPGVRAAIEAVSDPSQLLRVRLTGRVPRERFQEIDLAAIQAEANERNFYCQLETEGLTVYDHAEDLLIGYGVSFDAGAELKHQMQCLLEQYSDDAAEQEICHLAGQHLEMTYDRLTKGAR